MATTRHDDPLDARRRRADRTVGHVHAGLALVILTAALGVTYVVVHAS
jgi:hypothetical protein